MARVPPERIRAKKNPRKKRGFCYGRNLILQLGYIFGCRALRTFNNVELYTSTLLEGLEAFGLNCGVVNEYVFATILLNKTKTF